MTGLVTGNVEATLEKINEEHLPYPSFTVT